MIVINAEPNTLVPTKQYVILGISVGLLMEAYPG